MSKSDWSGDPTLLCLSPLRDFLRTWSTCKVSLQAIAALCWRSFPSSWPVAFGSKGFFLFWSLLQMSAPHLLTFRKILCLPKCIYQLGGEREVEEVIQPFSVIFGEQFKNHCIGETTEHECGSVVHWAEGFIRVWEISPTVILMLYLILNTTSEPST